MNAFHTLEDWYEDTKTYNYVGFLNGKSAVWCKPAVDGKETLYVSKDTGSGKTTEFSCYGYTTEPRQQELRILN